MEDGKRRKDDWGLDEKKPRVVGQKPAASLQGLAANHKAGMIHQSSCPVCLRSPLMTAPPETKAVAALRGRLGLSEVSEELAAESTRDEIRWSS